MALSYKLFRICNILKVETIKYEILKINLAVLLTVCGRPLFTNLVKIVKSTTFSRTKCD